MPPENEPTKREIDLSRLGEMRGVKDALRDLILRKGQVGIGEGIGEITIETIKDVLERERRGYEDAGFATNVYNLDQIIPHLEEIGVGEILKAAGVKIVETQAPEKKGGIPGRIQRGFGRLAGRKP